MIGEGGDHVMKRLTGLVVVAMFLVSPALVWGRGETAREHMSVVAETVEELLTTREDQGGIGQQVRVVAREQVQAQNQIEVELNKMESKSTLMKKLFGPDYKAVNSLKMQMEQNQLRIQQLEALKLEVTNEADETQLETMIVALTNQNTALSDQIMAEEGVSSLFGWLIRLFS